MSGGSKLTKITDGAVSFDGNGDYLYVPATDEFILELVILPSKHLFILILLVLMEM